MTTDNHLRILTNKISKLNIQALSNIINNSLTTFLHTYFWNYFEILVRTLSLAVGQISIDNRHVISIQLWDVSVFFREAKFRWFCWSRSRTNDSVDFSSHGIAFCNAISICIKKIIFIKIQMS